MNCKLLHNVDADSSVTSMLTVSLTLHTDGIDECILKIQVYYDLLCAAQDAAVKSDWPLVWNDHFKMRSDLLAVPGSLDLRLGYDGVGSCHVNDDLRLHLLHLIRVDESSCNNIAEYTDSQV